METPVLKTMVEAKRYLRGADRLIRGKDDGGYSHWLIERDGRQITVRAPYVSKANRHLRDTFFRQMGWTV